MRTKRFNFKVGIMIIVISIVLSFIYNTFSEDGIDFIRTTLKVQSVNVISDDGNLGELQGIDLTTSLEVFKKGNAVFIDARDQWEFSEGHIVGALNIPEFSFSEDNTLLKKIDKSSLIVIYCDGDDCNTSKRLTSKLLNLGFTKAYIYLGGFKEWKEAELPIEKGDK